MGTNRSGQTLAWPIDESTLSRHMILLGAIGMGKSNAMNHIVRSVRATMNRSDIMLIFDTKGANLAEGSTFYANLEWTTSRDLLTLKNISFQLLKVVDGVYYFWSS